MTETSAQSKLTVSYSITPNKTEPRRIRTSTISLALSPLRDKSSPKVSQQVDECRSEEVESSVIPGDLILGLPSTVERLRPVAASVTFNAVTLSLTLEVVIWSVLANEAQRAIELYFAQFGIVLT